MRACRFVSMLILALALDLVVPVAPTPAGLEFEDNEEVLHIAGVRVARPAPAGARAARTSDDAARPAPPTPPRQVAPAAAPTEVAALHGARSSPSDASAPASCGDDH